MKLLARAVLLLTVLSVTEPVAFGQTPSDERVYPLGLKSDLTVMAISGGAALVPALLENQIDPSCPCSTAEINGFDRGATKRVSNGLNRWGDVAVAFAVGLPVALSWADSRNSGGAWSDLSITGEAILINLAANQLTKIAVQRPRPFVYGLTPGDERLSDDDSYLSFYSQHTSTAFAAGLSYARTFALRHPDSRFRWLVYTAAMVNGAAVAALRVQAGMHFPTDVLTGAAVGGAIGLAVPWLHPKQDTVRVVFLPLRSAAVLSVRISL